MRKRKGFFTRQKMMVMGVLVGIAMIISFINILVSIVTAKEADSLVFESSDGLSITADIYMAYDSSSVPFIVMFHQANWSRGEYRETAPILNTMGYNCLAVDLRSGNKVRGVQNMTAQRAKALNKKISFVDSMLDMVAALNYVRNAYNPPKIVILGSSYSAGLALKIAGDYPGLIDGVIAFSPAEYFSKSGMSHTWVLESAKKITVPVFITSAQKEKNRWSAIFEAINTESKHSYSPETPGKHGSRALWRQYPDNKGYWAAMAAFLKTYF